MKSNPVHAALAAFDSKNPMPSLQDTQAIRAWRARRNIAKESAEADRNLEYQVELSYGRATCNNCLYGSAEWIQSRKDAAAAARDKDSASRAVLKTEKEAYVAAAAIYSPPATKQSRDFYAKVVHSNNALPILLNVQKAVDENPSVIAARASLARILINEIPPEQREATIKGNVNYSASPEVRARHRESAKSSDQLFGAIAQISRFVEEAEANNPSVPVVAQTQSATSPNAVTAAVRNSNSQSAVSALRGRTATAADFLLDAAGLALRAKKEAEYAGKVRQWNENRARAAADHARVMATPEAQLAIQADQARAAAEIASVRPAQELYDALIRQQDAARGPSGTTPVKKLKPAKKAPKKPLKKPKGRR